MAVFCVRVAHGYPVYHRTYDADRRLLLHEVNRFANVRTAGRHDEHAFDAIGRSTRRRDHRRHCVVGGIAPVS